MVSSNLHEQLLQWRMLVLLNVWQHVMGSTRETLTTAAVAITITTIFSWPQPSLTTKLCLRPQVSMNFSNALSAQTLCSHQSTRCVLVVTFNQNGVTLSFVFGKIMIVFGWLWYIELILIWCWNSGDEFWLAGKCNSRMWVFPWCRVWFCFGHKGLECSLNS